MSQLDRADKIKALLNSPNEGERAAAKAALDRLAEPERKPAHVYLSHMVAPPMGTPEFFAVINEWVGMIGFCVSRLGSPLLSAEEKKTIRFWEKHRGYPWGMGGSDCERIYLKLKSADDSARAVEDERTAQLSRPTQTPMGVI